MLDHLLGTSTWTKPPATYMKLHTGDPGEDAVLNASTETARQLVSWGSASAFAIASANLVEYLSLALSGPETLTAFSLWDAAGPAAGNPLAYGPLTDAATFDPGDHYRLAIGAIDLNLTGLTLTRATAAAALEHLVGKTTWAMPPGFFVKLHTGDPGVDAVLNAAAEATRVDAGAFSASAGGASDNDAIFGWSGVAASETISWISAWNASGAGTPLLRSALTTGKTLVAGQDAEFAAGSFDLSLA